MGKEFRSDIRAALPSGKVSAVYDPVLDALPRILASENVRAIVLGKDDGKYAVLALAESRVILVRTTMFGRISSEDLVLSAITSVEQKKQGFSAVVVLHASGNKLELGFVDKKAAERFSSAMRSAVDAARSPAAPKSNPSTSVAPSSRSSEQIKQAIRDLAELRDEGLLTNEEFESKKAALLDQL